MDLNLGTASCRLGTVGIPIVIGRGCQAHRELVSPAGSKTKIPEVPASATSSRAKVTSQSSIFEVILSAAMDRRRR
jgi:hypothetical protein